MPKLLVIDDRDQTVEMCHRHLPQFETVTRCTREIPCQVCEERERGCPYKCAHDYAEAAEVLARAQTLPDLIVLDLHFALPEERLLPEDKTALPSEAPARRRALETLRRTQGLLILERLRRAWPTLPVILLTTTGLDLEGAGAGEGTSADPLVYLCQNEVVDSRSLAAEIGRVLALHETAQEGAVFWGKSPAMRELQRALAVLARSPLPVLIEGETGTGKSFLAEHVLHARSGSKGPLVVTDLSTIPTALLPAHLFGARRGAFTGAVDEQVGVFEQAHGGTLFLDEIANLDLDLQRQLLLVLERGQVTRLGDTRPRPAAPKLVAATNVSLADLVQKGRFRADLYMRLNPASRLWVPPLRARREDLPELLRFAFLEALRGESLRPLVRAFLARFPTPEDFHEAHNQVVVGRPSAVLARSDAFSVFLGRASWQRLVQHDWPGNVRELRSFVVNALVHTLATQLDAATASRAMPTTRAEPRAPAILGLSDELVARLLGDDDVKEQEEGKKRPPSRTGGRRVTVEVPRGPSFARVAAEVERQYLRALFEASRGDLTAMAVMLLGPQGTARQMALRLNQLGLSLRELRAALPEASG